ncbi:MAG TPA: GNAT family N-acetyltransferase [Pyrinomonadaceae bacterium]|nr:GNAT family N-acetyltransferase [Pyrinomonadaceae bacterium]
MIETPRLRLVPCELIHFEAILENEKNLESLLDVTLADEWLGFPAAQEAMRPSYEFLKANPSALGWWTYLFVFKPEFKLIGLGGFKGRPTNEGVAEIGYALAPGYRGKGLATEAAAGLIDYAFVDPLVVEMRAHTLPERNASTRVLERVGMKYVGSLQDPTDGEVWRWSLERAQ